jgi:integrase
MKRMRYQEGSLRLYERKKGDQAWEYRWYETQLDGTRRRRSSYIGTLIEYPTEAAAKKAVNALRANINSETPRGQLQPISFETLTQHYRERELSEGSGKTFKTINVNEGYLERWITPRWSSYRLKDIKSVVVEEWLRSLPLANGSKAKIRNLMHAIFNHAIRWEWHDKNPMSMVRQSAKRQKVPTVLNIEQIKALLEHLEDPGKTAVLLDILTGLRVSELLALKWSDVDFENFRSMSHARLPTSMWVPARQRHRRSPFRSIRNWRRRS